jgi:hypothetical protein
VKLNEKPKCSLCSGQSSDISYVFLANAKGKGGQLVHKMCFNDSRREEQEALREARKAARLRTEKMAVKEAQRAADRALANLEEAKLEVQQTSQSKDTVVEVDTLRVNSQTN